MREYDWYLMPRFIYQGEVFDLSDNVLDASSEMWEFANQYAQDGLLIEIVPLSDSRYNVSIIYDEMYFSDNIIQSLSCEIADTHIELSSNE